MITRTERNQQFDPAGRLLAETVVDVDVTAEAVEYDLHAKARQALEANRAFLASTPTNAQALAQVTALTRQLYALAKLVIADFTE